VSERGWQRKFEDPIELADGQMLVTLRDAATLITGLSKRKAAVCTENLIRVDDVLESPKLVE
jgi:hypothetical protein